MGKIIAVSNQKGGVGKSTTTVNLASCLAEKGKKVLIVDLDPQGNTTTGLGIAKNTLEYTIYEGLLGQCSLKDMLKTTPVKGLLLIPANINLAGAEIEFIKMKDRESLLKNILNYLKDDFDFIFIDCPPSLSMLTINALVAADSVINPIQTEFYAIEGYTQLNYTINMVKQSFNQKLSIDGIIFTMFNKSTNLSTQVVAEVLNNIHEHTYHTIIPRTTRLAEAPSFGLPINLYDPSSKGCEAYRNLAKEFLERQNKKGDN